MARQESRARWMASQYGDAGDDAPTQRSVRLSLGDGGARGGGDDDDDDSDEGSPSLPTSRNPSLQRTRSNTLRTEWL